MSLVKDIALRPLESIQGGMARFYTPQSCNETMLVQIPAGTIDDLFVHRNQTDQLLVARGSFVLVILSDRRYRYIPLGEHKPQVVTIPPGVPHGAINLENKPCFLVNAVIRHGETISKDYRPMKPPFPYDLAAAREVLARCHALASVPVAR
ncbi:cupin domain-containing protein [Pannus brasiliensis CCIBt3594]|uniref:Cupin domain-containing protein n=1 Tax=Pannus brasiliensis CCIBt3594 TaxID=1427578 RepID=A0AAW9QWI8_9CHRO